MNIFQKILTFFKGKDYAFIWQEFALKHHGTYHSIPGDRVEFSYKSIPITFDHCSNYTVSGPRSMQANYLRGIASFVAAQPFHLLITEQGILEKVSKLFGSQDIRVGDPLFDGAFMIRSNDEAMTQMILSDPVLIAQLQELKPARLEITDGDGLFGEKPEAGKTMLYVVVEGVVQHADSLVKFYELFARVLDALSKTKTIQST
jgi:hypothetical protein